MENQILITLKNNKLFSNIPFEELDFGKINGSFISVHEGEILFREKAKSNLLYLIVSGEINLLTKQVNTKAQSLIFTDNDFLGCEEFLANIARKSTAVALRDSYLIAMTKDEVDSLIEQNYDILNNIYASIPDSDNENISPAQPLEEANFKAEIKSDEKSLEENVPEQIEKASKNAAQNDEVVPETPSSTEEVFTPDVIIDVEEKIETLNEIQSEESMPSHALTTEKAILPDEPESFKEISKTPEEAADKPSAELDDFNFSERFGQNDSFLNDFQNMTQPENEKEKLKTEAGEEENTTDFYKQDYSFYKPNEPVQIPDNSFAKDLVDEKLNQQTTESNSEPKEQNLNIDGEYFPTIDHLIKINEAAGLVNSNIKIDDILKNIVTVACDLTNADRGTLYFVDKEKNELWSKVAMGSEFREIKLKVGEGIAGWVAQSGEILNLENVREDARFNSSFDKSSGYETKNMICFPIKNQNEDVVGVLQLLNSRKNKFSKIDEEFLKALSIHIALAFRNANMVENLLSNERVSSLGKMANFLIQDIKKPILVSKRYAEHLKSKDLNEDVVKIVDMLLEQLNHIADLIQSTLSYSEGQIILRSIVKNINDVLNDFIGRIDSYVKSRNCKISKKFDANVNVKIAEKQFYQAFEHIIKNACDAMPDGGDIQIETQKSGNNILVSISDAGLGIPESLHQKIFEPFLSLGKRDATGLGLSITKKIIEEHGGSISVKSQMGEGATFTISFPIIFTY